MGIPLVLGQGSSRRDLAGLPEGTADSSTETAGKVRGIRRVERAAIRYWQAAEELDIDHSGQVERARY